MDTGPRKQSRSFFSLDKSGWKIDGDEIEHEWMKGNLIVPEQLIDIVCDQNVEGEPEQDGYDDYDLSE